ncbi:PE-PPE domain-containing protein [Mycobacterium sp. SMC-4]|uniref:PE-PPE domain-containing protein n=1 Tax=Mycobacterium sp. SMC-4 TaxID=2857059 RepID=UPI003D04B0B2
MMSSTKRSAGRRVTRVAAAAASIPLFALLSAPASASAVALPDGPARVLTLSLLPNGNNDDLQGKLCEEPRVCQAVQNSYLSSRVSFQDLDATLRDGTTGQQIVFGYSQGARVAADWLEAYAGTQNALPASDLTFILMGNPQRKYGGSDNDLGHTFPQTEYKVIDVSREYDLASDFPSNPFNLLAMLNAHLGFFMVHAAYEDVDLDSPDNYVWTEGNTTYVFVPTERLPLLEPLHWIGLGGVAAALDPGLRAVIDAAYDRSYLPEQPGVPPTEPVTEEPTDPAATPLSRRAATQSVDSAVRASARETTPTTTDSTPALDVVVEPDEDVAAEPAEAQESLRVDDAVAETSVSDEDASEPEAEPVARKRAAQQKSDDSSASSAGADRSERGSDTGSSGTDD